jgi:hypothetical protein
MNVPKCGFVLSVHVVVGWIQILSVSMIWRHIYLELMGKKIEANPPKF